MAKAIRGAILGESKQSVEVEGNQYFRPTAMQQEYFRPGSAPRVCPSKGTASYYDREVNGEPNQGAAWYRPLAETSRPSD